ncbi:MAG: DUF1569 domain-containing protein [Bacteroidota bacterium]
MDEAKLQFLRTGTIPLLKNLGADAKGKWGKMNGQQMVEHLSAFFKVSVNKIYFPLVTPVEHLPKYKEFLLSDKEFRENTKASILPEEPFPVRNANMQGAITELESSIDDFFNHYADDPNKKELHAVFGELNFEEWVQLHHKHVTHHFKQFGLL